MSRELEIGGLRLRPRWVPRQVALLAALVLAGTALIPAAIATLLPPTYGAQLELLLKPRFEASDTAVERAMLTEEAILKSPSVLGPVAAEAGVPLGWLESQVVTTMLGRSNVLRVTIADRDRDRALSLVRGVERQYAAVHAADAKVDPTSPVAPTLRYTVLTAPRVLDEPVAPRPLQVLAAGAIVGILAAGAVAVVLLRPVFAASGSSP